EMIPRHKPGVQLRVHHPSQQAVKVLPVLILPTGPDLASLLVKRTGSAVVPCGDALPQPGEGLALVTVHAGTEQVQAPLHCLQTPVHGHYLRWRPCHGPLPGPKLLAEVAQLQCGTLLSHGVSSHTPHYTFPPRPPTTNQETRGFRPNAVVSRR